MIVGCGKAVIGNARHILVQFGFRTAMLFAMDVMYSSEVAGDEEGTSNAAVLCKKFNLNAFKL